MTFACHIDFPRYVISDSGEIVSHVFRKPRTLKSALSGKYLGLSLKHRDGHIVRDYLHRVICETFHGAPAVGQEVRHMDGNRFNNAASNLRWGTRAQNMRDKNTHGTAPVGARHPQAKLTDQDILDIRLVAEYGLSPQVVMRHYEISRMQHWRIVNRKAWTHI